jgi:ATP adenylyltransferase
LTRETELKRLWAPWRREYILGPKAKACIFCQAPQLDPQQAGVLLRGERCFVMLNKYPYINGHLLISPLRHVSQLEDLDVEETAELMETVRDSVRRLKQAFGPDGLNLGMNLGKVAGAGVEEHLHFHLLPRWSGDNNFMAVLADTRVISESLSDTWATLSPFFAERKDS